MATTKKRVSKRRKPTAAIEYAGNEWLGCVGANAAALDKLARTTGRPLSAHVRELLATCAGGRPRRSFYFSRNHDVEVGVGYVLLVDRGSSKMTDVACAVQVIARDSARKETAANDLVPFAVDNGNAHYLCVDREGRVVYRILHEPPETERRVVADSLPDFLAGLKEEP